MERKLPTREKLKELLRQTDEKLKELSKDLEYDSDTVTALSHFYDAMKRVFVKKKLRKAINQSISYEDLERFCKASARNNKGYNFVNNDVRKSFSEYRLQYVKCFLDLVRDEMNGVR